MSKIVFFDIDGTLHYSGIGIPESAIKAVNQLIANGHKAVMCTGRSKGMMPEEYFHMGFHGMILGAGAYVEYEGKVIHQELMSEQEVQTVIDWGKKQKVGIILEGEQHGYYDPDNHDDYYVAMKNKTEVDCETTLYPISEAVDVPVNSVEFVPMGVNKAKGIEQILEYTGISRDDSYAFGDSANDINMIQYVKYGTAMGNSVPELLEVAPYKTARADEDGIEKGLKKFGLI